MDDRREMADEILKYIQSGMDSDHLSDKFKSSYEELQNVVGELVDAGLLEPVDALSVAPSKRAINAKEIAKDIRSGMARSELITKYQLTPRMLQSALKKLVHAKKLSPSELSGDLSYQYRAESPEKVRGEARFCLDFDLPIFEKGYHEIRGRIVDISERGVGVVGPSARVGEIRHFVVHHEDFFEIEPFSFEAECRWTKGEQDRLESLSGYRIIRISDKDLDELRKLIRLLGL
jgi:hypothetical protein